MALKNSNQDLLGGASSDLGKKEIEINPSIYKVDYYLNIKDWTCRLFSGLVAGAGLYFASENKQIKAVFAEFQKKNNLDLAIEDIVYDVAAEGRSINTVDCYDQLGRDLRIGFTQGGIVARLNEDIAGVTIWKDVVINELGLVFRVREVWTEEVVKRFFYFGKALLTVGEFLLEVPPKYRIFAENKLFKPDPTNNFVWAKNKLGIIPIVEFRLNRRKVGLWPDQKILANWTRYLNQLITEAQRDISTTKPRFILTGITSADAKQINKTDLSDDLILQTNEASRTMLEPKIIQPVERFTKLADVLTKQIKMMLYSLRLSADVSGSQTTSAGEQKESGSQIRLVRQSRTVLNFQIREYLKKVFKIAGVSDDQVNEFTVNLKDNTAMSEAELINNAVQKVLIGLDKKESVADVKNTDGEATDHVKVSESADIQQKQQGESFNSNQPEKTSYRGK